MLAKLLAVIALCGFICVYGQGGLMGMLLGMSNEFAAYLAITVGSRVQG